MPRRYRRHERFDARAAARPELQLRVEADAARSRDFIQDCIDYVDGRETPGAARAEAEHKRLLKLAKEAKRRALVGADPLNITGHTTGKPAKKVLAGDPVEFVGTITRTKPSVTRLHGKNKLDLRQLMAAETYRDAYETVRSVLGGSLNFDRVNNTGFSNRSPADERLMAADTLTEAKQRLGAQAVIIIEMIVCDGRTIEECTRRLYGVQDGEKTVARDVNFVGRRLREALTELADLWHPATRSPRVQSFRPPKGEVVAGEAGVYSISSTPYVSR